jgi:hypothetical protein
MHALPRRVLLRCRSALLVQQDILCMCAKLGPSRRQGRAGCAVAAGERGSHTTSFTDIAEHRTRCRLLTHTLPTFVHPPAATVCHGCRRRSHLGPPPLPASCVSSRGCLGAAGAATLDDGRDLQEMIALETLGQDARRSRGSRRQEACRAGDRHDRMLSRLSA